MNDSPLGRGTGATDRHPVGARGAVSRKRRSTPAGAGSSWSGRTACGAGTSIGRRRVGESIDRPSGALWSVAFSPDGAWSATAAEDGPVQLYDTNGWTRTGSHSAPTSISSASRSRPMGRDCWRVRATAVCSSGTSPTTRSGGPPIAAHGTNDVWELVVDPTGGGRDRQQRRHGPVWSLARDSSPALRGHEGAARSRRRPAWSGRRTARPCTRAERRPRARMGRRRQRRRSMSTSATTTGSPTPCLGRSAVLVTLGRDQDVRVWDMANRRGGGDGWRISLRHSVLWPRDQRADGGVGSRSGTATAVHVFRGHGEDLELTGHDGKGVRRRLPAERPARDGGDGGSRATWDLSSGRIDSARENERSVAITSSRSRCGKRVATSGDDGAVRVWSTTT